MMRLVLGILLAPVFFGVLSILGNLVVQVFYPGIVTGSVPQSMGYFLLGLVLR